MPVNSLNYHKRVLLIAAITFLLSVLSFLWIVVFDKGTLSLSSEQIPFSVRAWSTSLKVPKNFSCEQNPCTLKLPSGSYEFTFQKEGYFEEAQSLALQRGENQSLSVHFDLIPTLEPAGDYEDYSTFFEATSREALFALEMDTTYDKQALIYTDPATEEKMVWAYFDRPLENPLIFVHPSEAQALVVDRADVEEKLYWVNGKLFQRAYVGTLRGVERVLWGAWNEAHPQVLVRTVASRTGTSHWWLTDLQVPSVQEWAMTPASQQVVWTNEGTLVFLTQQALHALENTPMETPLDAVKALVSDEISTDPTSFTVGEYDPAEGTYRGLYSVPPSLGLSFENTLLGYDRAMGRLFLTDKQSVYEIIFLDKK